MWLANHAALELHPWTSRIADVHLPTYALIDLDPGPETTWDELLLLARLHRTALEHLGVRGVPEGDRAAGRPGVDTDRRPDHRSPTPGRWVEQLSRAIGAIAPELVSWKWEKRGRGGLARLDYTQNAINKTLVAPYSPRPAPGAPVSAPIAWDELDDPELAPDRWTIRTILDRVAAIGDLMAPALAGGQRLPPFE